MFTGASVLTSVASSCCLLFVIVEIGTSEQMSKDKSWNVALVFVVHDDRDTVSVVLDRDVVLFHINLDVKFVHVGIALIVISRIYDN